MIIDARALAKTFRRRDAVRNLTLQVPEGSALALIGPNGAGKTTSLRLLANILRPDRGDAFVLGVDSRRLSEAEWQRIGFVSESQQLPRALSVEAYFDYLRPLYDRWDAALEQSLRKRFDIPPVDALSKLSHGTRIKVLLVAALAYRPQLLLLDEPLSGLDPLTRDEVLEGLLSQAGETTIVLSSHELTEIERCITHVAFMDRGETLFQDTAETLSARFRDVVVFFDSEATIRGPYSGTWIQPAIVGQTLQFVDTAFRGTEELHRAVQACGGPVRHVEARGMTLREISTALMRAVRSESAR